MRTVVMIVCGLIGGFLGGLILSELIGIVGVLLFDRAVGIRFLPLYLAVVGAVVAPIVDAQIRRARKTAPCAGKDHL
jgi:Family of unknown function (DUF5957)